MCLLTIIVEGAVCIVGNGAISSASLDLYFCPSVSPIDSSFSANERTSSFHHHGVSVNA